MPVLASGVLKVPLKVVRLQKLGCLRASGSALAVVVPVRFFCHECLRWEAGSSDRQDHSVLEGVSKSV